MLLLLVCGLRRPGLNPKTEIRNPKTETRKQAGLDISSDDDSSEGDSDDAAPPKLSGHPSTRNPKPETRNLEPETRNPNDDSSEGGITQLKAQGPPRTCNESKEEEEEEEGSDDAGPPKLSGKQAETSGGYTSNPSLSTLNVTSQP